ncbi:MAG: tetratricopeptide repeat protein [Pseudolabrys sp.]|nr:tetratricopeptide repeat protein [Pseudolabrys sp.]
MAGDRIYRTTLERMSADDLRARLAAGPEEAARWIYAAAVNGYAEAQAMWGQMLLDGRHVAADPAAALRWFRIAASSGHLDGINMVGRCYERGWGVAPDPAEAARWFRQAADKGHDWARFNLATLLLKGEGVAPDVREALSLLVCAARRGHAKSMNLIGVCREQGWRGRVNMPSAIRWYRRAANGGCFRGSYHLGRFLATAGEIKEAAFRFQRAVDSAPADFCRDAAAALLARPEPELQTVGRRALLRATASDNPADLFAYGRALALGRGGPADLAAAKVWLARATAKNYPGAAAALDDVLAREQSARWRALRQSVTRLPVALFGAGAH